jgi:hypothetical protein
VFLNPTGMPKRDATSPTPRTARDIQMGRERYSREGLETAWLLLQEYGGTPDRNQMSAVYAHMRAQGWDIAQAVELVQAAAGWTGEIVHSCANCPCD